MNKMDDSGPGDQFHKEGTVEVSAGMSNISGIYEDTIKRGKDLQAEGVRRGNKAIECQGRAIEQLLAPMLRYGFTELAREDTGTQPDAMLTGFTAAFASFLVTMLSNHVEKEQRVQALEEILSTIFSHTVDDLKLAMRNIKDASEIEKGIH